MAPILLSCRTRHLRPLVWVVAMCFSNGMHQIISDYYWRRWLIQITLVARSLAQRREGEVQSVIGTHSKCIVLVVKCDGWRMYVWNLDIHITWAVTRNFKLLLSLHSWILPAEGVPLANNFETTLRIQLPHKWGLHYLVAFPTHVTSARGQPLSWCFLSETPTLIDSSYWNYGKGFECVMGC